MMVVGTCGAGGCWREKAGHGARRRRGGLAAREGSRRQNRRAGARGTGEAGRTRAVQREEEAPGSVDTPLTGVDTMLQTQGKIRQNRSSSVDTRSSSVDTRDNSQKPSGSIWDSVSTLVQGSVDTPLTGVDTMLQTQGKIRQNWSSSVDTRSNKTFNTKYDEDN
ncbi:hypothetical protein Taro_009319 [Colocasia esculenta]|uniref:Uncharacterized protein n=1 Tax=Colocasia esculenta TaxID=4460 RepID=A0A843TZU4_COLES|nr:hypothetical protein [Colocasia esculenta]